jgi:hypothetical protein
MTHSCVSEQQYCRGALGAALALLLCVGLSARAAAQPPGAAIGVGPISALAVDPHTPTTLYASTECSGVLKSLDGGDTWTAKTSGLGEPVPGVGALAIDPVTPTTVYAGTTAGVFKSTDGGDTWSVANSGLGEPAPGVGALAIDPVTPTTVYAGTEAGVFKSTDGGNTWGAPSLTRISVVELDIDPTVPTTLYAVATQDQRRGVHKSTDGGSSWVLVYTSREISSVAVDPSTPGTLYLGGSHFSEAGRSVAVVKSTDGAETWFPVITTGSPRNSLPRRQQEHRRRGDVGAHGSGPTRPRARHRSQRTGHALRCQWRRRPANHGRQRDLAGYRPRRWPCLRRRHPGRRTSVLVHRAVRRRQPRRRRRLRLQLHPDRLRQFRSDSGRTVRPRRRICHLQRGLYDCIVRGWENQRHCA